jgi:hypothetical protein
MTSEVKTARPEFIHSFLQHMGQICADQQQRLQASRQDLTVEERTELLSKGIWYPKDYCSALEKWGFNQRLDWLVQKGRSYHGWVPKTFTHVVDKSYPLGKKTAEFQIAQGVVPSEALASLGSSPCILDCGSVISLAAYRALKDVLGEEKFNVLVASYSKTPLQIAYLPMRKLLFKHVQLKSSRELQPGDICHITNIELIGCKKPFSHAMGYNLVCKSNREQPELLGFGLPAENTFVQNVEQDLLDAYNDPSDPEQFIASSVRDAVYKTSLKQDVSKSKALVDSLKTKTLTKEQFKKLPNRVLFDGQPMEGRLYLIVNTPDLEKIQRLVDASLKDVRKIWESP